MSIGSAFRSMSTIRRTTRVVSCNSRHRAPAARYQFGIGLTDAAAGSVRNVYLVVPNLEAARSRLLEHGVDVDEIRHKVPIDAWDGNFAPGLDATRRDYASFAGFSDPDGNSWVLQERGYRR
ncbi:hypothetical protein ACVWY2_003435 [Bradyrhizobium sp. JR6.1]